MGVAQHLGIKTEDYDRQILTFIPHYDEILDAAARALGDAAARPIRTIVDLGTGSGALAARCLARTSRTARARVLGIDSDESMLSMAGIRLGKALTPTIGNFERAPFPACDAVTASFALHHVPTPARKKRVFTRAFEALRPGGVIVDADCMLPSSTALQTLGLDRWRTHLAESHGDLGARRFLRAWSREDTYFTLEVESRLMREAGFVVDVVARFGAFAVLVGSKPRRRMSRRA